MYSARYVTVVSVGDALRWGSDRQPDVVLSRWAPSMQMQPNTISNWGGFRSVAPMASSPCSVGTKPLAVPNTLVHNKLNY